MTESVSDDALLQAIPHNQAFADLVLLRYKILSTILAATFLIKYCSLLGSDLNCYGHVTDIHPFKRDKLSVKALFSSLKIILAKTIACHSKRNEKGMQSSEEIYLRFAWWKNFVLNFWLILTVKEF